MCGGGAGSGGGGGLNGSIVGSTGIIGLGTGGSECCTGGGGDTEAAGGGGGPHGLEGPGSATDDAVHLKRRVGLVSGVALIVGTMIGNNNTQ